MTKTIGIYCDDIMQPLLTMEYKDGQRHIRHVAGEIKSFLETICEADTDIRKIDAPMMVMTSIIHSLMRARDGLFLKSIDAAKMIGVGDKAVDLANRLMNSEPPA
jgi:hypothetical protein